MSQRVVWVVEFLGETEWRPSEPPLASVDRAQTERIAEIRRQKCHAEYRAWPYAAKESAQ